jgi:hypothetical protein
MLHRSFHAACLIAAAALLWHAAAPLASAQYPYGGPGGQSSGPGYVPSPPVVVGGYAPPGYGGGGGYWNGQAAALDAYSNLGLAQEQARIVREQSKQAKLETKKQTIDAMAYERAHKYGYSDEQRDLQGKKIQFALNNPPTTEIISGRTLNTLLPYLDQIMVSGKGSQTIPLDPSVVKALNVTSGEDNGNVGLLKDVNNLQWPESTLGPTQKTADELLKQATAEGQAGPVPVATLSKLRKTADALEDEVRKKFQKSEIDGGEYLEGNRYIKRVRDAIAALKQPNVGKFLSGALAPRGDTVDELVYNMSSKGLTFAPAQPGQEFAYIAAQQAFANFVWSAGTPETGFRVMVKGGY